MKYKFVERYEQVTGIREINLGRPQILIDFGSTGIAFTPLEYEDMGSPQKGDWIIVLYKKDDNDDIDFNPSERHER